MRVLVISPEAGAWPYPSSLADSVNCSVKAFQGLGAEVRVYSPCFQADSNEEILSTVSEIHAGHERVRGEGFSILGARGSVFHYVRNQAYFSRNGHYNDPGDLPYWDNHYRFSLLVSAALQHCVDTGFEPDFIQGHEWGASLIGAYARSCYKEEFGKVPVFFTIHNIEYDFHFLEHDIDRIGLDRRDFNMDGYEFWGKVSMLKAGILYADVVTFASDGYRNQVLDRDLAGGIRGFLEAHQAKIVGVQHGIDYSRWSSFKGAGVLEQKRAAKAKLQTELGLAQEDKFIVYCHLDRETVRTAETLFTILTDLFHLPIQLVVGLPSSFPEQEYFHALSRQNPGRLGVMLFGPGTESQQRALAGSDVLFLSNTDEPSASLVIKALCNGVIPLAGRDIGCADLLTPLLSEDASSANALLVEDPWPDQMLRSVRHGLDLYTNERPKWELLVSNALAFRYPWEKTASAFLALKS